MKLAVRPTGGSAPEAPCRARCNAPASEGGACCRLSPPKGDSDDLEAAISFLLRTRSRGHFQPLFFSGKLSGKKRTGTRLNHVVRTWCVVMTVGDAARLLQPD